MEFRNVVLFHFRSNVWIVEANRNSGVRAVRGEELPVFSVGVRSIIVVVIQATLDTIAGEHNTTNPEDDSEES